MSKIGRIPGGGGWRAHGRAMGSTAARKRTPVGYDFERFNRTLATEWAYARAFTSNDQRTAALATWLEHYNTERRTPASPERPRSAECHQPDGPVQLGVFSQLLLREGLEALAGRLVGAEWALVCVPRVGRDLLRDGLDL